MKAIKWLLILLITSGVALAGIVFALNFQDQTLKPEVAEVFTEAPSFSEAQTKAFYYALGMHAGAAKNIEAKGRELFKKFSALKSTERREFWESKIAPKSPWDETFIGCVPDYRVCTADFILKANEIRQELAHGSGTMDQYITLLNYQAIGDVYQGDSEIPFTNVWLTSKRQHRKLLLYLATWLLDGKSDEAFKVLRNANLYFVSMLKDPSSFELPTAAQALNDNAEFLKAEMLRRPSFKPSNELLTSFAVPSTAVIFKAAINRQLRLVKNLTTNFLTQKEGPVLGNLWRALPMRYLLLPAQTYNEFWDINHKGQSEVLTATNPLQNPIGTKVLKLTDLRLEQRKEHVESLLQPARDLAAKAQKN